MVEHVLDEIGCSDVGRPPERLVILCMTIILGSNGQLSRDVYNANVGCFPLSRCWKN